jgi:hypothetical protein
MGAGSSAYLSAVAAISCATASLRWAGSKTQACLPNGATAKHPLLPHVPPASPERHTTRLPLQGTSGQVAGRSCRFWILASSPCGPTPSTSRRPEGLGITYPPSYSLLASRDITHTTSWQIVPFDVDLSAEDGNQSTTLYVKESGTGNTGWVAK